MDWVDVRTKKIGKSAILMLGVLASVYTTLTYYTDRNTGLITPEDHYILSAGLAERILAHSNGDLEALNFVNTSSENLYGTNYTTYNLPVARLAYDTRNPEVFDGRATIAGLIRASAYARQWYDARHWILKDDDFEDKVGAAVLEPVTFTMTVNAGVVNFSGYDLNFLCFGNLSRADDYYYYNYKYAKERMSWGGSYLRQGGYNYYRPFVNIMAGYYDYGYKDTSNTIINFHDHAVQKPVTYNGDSTITNWWAAIGNTNKTYSFTFQNSERWQYVFANPTEYAAVPRYIFGTKDFLIEAEQFLQSLNCIAFVDSDQALVLSITNYVGYKGASANNFSAYNPTLLADVGAVFATLQTEPSYVGDVSKVDDGTLHTARQGGYGLEYWISAETHKTEQAEKYDDPLVWEPVGSSYEIDVRIPVPKFKTVEPTTKISQTLLESGVISKVHVFAPFRVQGVSPPNYGDPSSDPDTTTIVYKTTPYNEGSIFTSILASTLTEPYKYVSGSIVNPYTIKYEGVGLHTVSYPSLQSMFYKFVKIATIVDPTSTNDLRILGSTIDIAFGVDEIAATTLDVGFDDLNEKHTEVFDEYETSSYFRRSTIETISREKSFEVYTYGPSERPLFYIVEFDFEFFNPDPTP